MAPKKSSKDEKPEEKAHKPKDDAKNLPNEERTSDSCGQSCSTWAQALIYIVPIALYIPWAYRMFKGQPCCHEVPKPPPTAKPKWPKCPGQKTGKGEGEACEFEMPTECQGETVTSGKEDCKKSRQCLDRCLDKCFSKDGSKAKGGKRQKRRDECDDEEDY